MKCEHKWATIGFPTQPTRWAVCILCEKPRGEAAHWSDEKKQGILKDLLRYSSLTYVDPVDILLAIGRD